MFDAAQTDFLCIPDLLKARPAEDAGERLIYLEASNEARDLQNEVVLAKALADSATYYARFGNVDLDHLTQIGPRMGFKDYMLFEIGRPADVRVDGARTFVKAVIYQGEGQVAERANQFWDSVTRVQPPHRWYPSVGGGVLEKAQQVGADGVPHTVIKRVRWTNIGLSRTPVNPVVPTVSTIPVGVLAKSWGAAGLDLTKALEAGYGTDSASLAGGGAMRTASQDRRLQSYWSFRDEMAGAIRRKAVTPSAAALAAHAERQFGLTKAQAAEWTERFLRGVAADLKHRKEKHP